jgi:hypothetical protein
MIGYALTLNDDAEAWDGLSLVMGYHLTWYERASLLMATCRSMATNDVAYVLEAMEEREGTGMPLPPFLDTIDDATWWAGLASVEERKAVLTAAFLSLSPRDRDAFLAYASRRIAA